MHKHSICFDGERLEQSSVVLFRLELTCFCVCVSGSLPRLQFADEPEARTIFLLKGALSLSGSMLKGGRIFRM